MTFEGLPESAAWRHAGVRDGFEVVFFRAEPGGYVLAGHTSAVEDGRAWAVHYTVLVDRAWGTRSARVTGWSPPGERTVTIERADDVGRLGGSGGGPGVAGGRDGDLRH